jgi:CrcB protein
MNRLLLQYIVVGGAGAVGAALRLFVATVCARWFGRDYPVGTFLINVSGSLFLGWFMAVVGRGGISDTTRLAVAVGFVGAYTTFSTFAFESNALIEGGSWTAATVNMVGSVVVGLLAVRVGIWLGRG